MSDTRWPHITPTVLALLVFAAGLALPCATTAASGEGDNPGWVRMTVDPTVLPPVQPPLMPEKNAQGNSPDGAASQGEAPAVGGENDLPPESARNGAAKQAPSEGEASSPEPSPSVSETPPAAPAEPAGGGVVSSVKAAYAGKALVLTVACDRPVAGTDYMNLEGPRRLVVDLAGKWTVKTRNVIRLKGGKAKLVVLGEHPDKLRLVVHFRTPPAGRLQPRFKPGKGRLVITVPLP